MGALLLILGLIALFGGGGGSTSQTSYNSNNYNSRPKKRKRRWTKKGRLEEERRLQEEMRREEAERAKARQEQERKKAEEERRKKEEQAKAEEKQRKEKEEAASIAQRFCEGKIHPSLKTVIPIWLCERIERGKLTEEERLQFVKENQHYLIDRQPQIDAHCRRGFLLRSSLETAACNEEFDPGVAMEMEPHLPKLQVVVEEILEELRKDQVILRQIMM